MSQEANGGWDRYDVLEFSDGSKTVCPAGDAEIILEAHKGFARKRRLIAVVLVGLSLPVVAVIFGTVFFDSLLGSLAVGLGLGMVGAIVRYSTWTHEGLIPEVLATDASRQVVEDHVADFNPDEVTAATE